MGAAVDALRGVGKTLLVLCAAFALCAGAFGLALTYAPGAPGVLSARDAIAGLLERVLPHLSSDLRPGHVIGWLTAAPWRFLLAPAGIITLGVTLLPGAASLRASAET